MRNKIVLIAVIAVAALGIIWYQQKSGARAPEVAQTTDETTEDNGFITASGTVVPSRQTKLGFPRMGRLKRITVQVGDSVRAGQTLAELDAADLQADVEAAQEALNLAKAQLAQVEAGSRPEEVAGARAAYQGTLARYSQVVAGATEAEKETAAAAVETAKERLSQAEASTKAQEKMAEARLDAANARLAQLQAGAKAEDIRAAELQLEQARNSLWAAQIERDGLKGNPVNPEYLGKAGDAKVAAAETAVHAAEISLKKLKDGPSAEDLRIARAAVAQAEAELAAARDTKETTLQAAISGLRSTEARLAQLNQGATPQEREIAASSVASSKAALDLRAAGPTQPDLEAAKARVRQAESLLRRTKVDLEEATLAAPFPGVVASVGANEGEVMVLGTPFLVLGDMSNLRIETTDLRETSVARVRVGQPVEITFDALPEKVVRGKVARIAPIATSGAGGTNYAATIELDGQDPALRWGMTANASIDVR